MSDSIKHLSAIEISDGEYSFYSVDFESDKAKQYFVVNVHGEGQAILYDENGRPRKFETKQDALTFCKTTWPALTAMIKP